MPGCEDEEIDVNKDIGGNERDGKKDFEWERGFYLIRKII
jgi:hypothetical protein